MILSRPLPEFGIFFAIWPRRIDTGELVAFEFLHYEWEPGWGWGSSGFWKYKRWVPQDQYDRGERAQTVALCRPFNELPRSHCEPFDGMKYMTPPDPARCEGNPGHGTAACWYPHCDCMNPGIFPCGREH